MTTLNSISLPKSSQYNQGNIAPLLIHGKSVELESNQETLKVVYPGDGESLAGTCALLSESQIDAVLVAAQKGADTFRHTTATERSKILYTLADLLENNLQEMARLITLETGKPIKLATVETNRAIIVCRGYAKQLEWQESKNYFIEGREATVRYYPLGAVLAITPYNFPLNLVVHKLAPAIAAGNSITIKPASKTPLTALFVGQLAAEAGYDAISVIPSRAALAERLVRSDVFKKLSFTGSSDIGWHLKAVSGKKVVTLELGGNAGCIVESVADSVETAATRCAQGGFWLSGQSCISVQRVFVHHTLYEAFMKAFVAATRQMKVGDPLLPDTDIGTMISPEDVTRCREWVEEAVRQGAELVYGGEAVNAYTMTPTILAQTKPEMKVNCDEVFGPVVTVTPYQHFEAALAAVNDSSFGLQAGIFTTDRNQAHLAYETLDVGGVIINDVPTFRLDYLPYGGQKDSGLGREGVLTGVAEMSYIKTMIRKPD